REPISISPTGSSTTRARSTEWRSRRASASPWTARGPGTSASAPAGTSTSRASPRNSAVAAIAMRRAAPSTATRRRCGRSSRTRWQRRSRMSEPSGVVVVNKPSGPTSFDVVRRLKGLFKVKRCGHTGTLDPTATGVLPICVGEATKVAGFIADGEKEYEATVRFGQVTDTQDSAGKVLETRPVEGLREDRAREVLGEFVGLVLQTPPMYSARKVDGRRLYELARAGEEVEREARPVHIEEARLTSFDPLAAAGAALCPRPAGSAGRSGRQGPRGGGERRGGDVEAFARAGGGRR